MNAGCASADRDPLRTRATPERLRGVFATRRYTNLRLPLPYLYLKGNLSLDTHPCSNREF